MLMHVVYSVGLVFTTVAIHAFAHFLVAVGSDAAIVRPRIQQSLVSRVALIAAFVVLMSATAVIESAIWAGLYVAVGAIPDFPDALYFSLVTFTTLGYGDITLNEEWRLLGGFQAANGIIIFGWTTALLVYVIQRLAALSPSRKTRP